MDERDRPWGTLVDFSNTATTVEDRSTVRDLVVGAGGVIHRWQVVFVSRVAGPLCGHGIDGRQVDRKNGRR